MKRTYIVLSAPLLLSGCMMLGSGGMGLAGGGGMHGASHDASTRGQTVVRDSVVNGIRITAEFPPYVLGDALTYAVTLREVRRDSPISDASIELIVTSNDAAHTAASAGHGNPSVTQSHEQVGTTTVSPSAVRSGTYVFRPAITQSGAYRFVFRVQRVGIATLDPPIAIEHTVQLRAPMDRHSGSGDRGNAPRIAPAALIGAGAMAIMMIFTLR